MCWCAGFGGLCCLSVRALAMVVRHVWNLVGVVLIVIGFNSSGADASDIIRVARLKYEKWCPGWGGLFGASFVLTD